MTFSSRAALSRAIVILLVAAVALTLLQTFAGPDAHSRRRSFGFKHAERCVMKRINRRRARQGLHKLRWDKQLAYVARRHAKAMARAGGGIWHDSNLGQRVTRWRALGQNTGRGRRCRSLVKAFWRSSGHRANILGRWRYQGVGIKWRRGRLYVQQVFESRNNPGNVYTYP